MDKAQILADFATNWRKTQPFTVPDGALTGDNLYKFIKDFQDEVVKTISFEPMKWFENINYIGLAFVELCAILGIVSPKYNMR